MRAIWNWIVRTISGEWLLDGQPNGGDIIIARSLVASSLLFLGYVALRQSLDPARTWSFSLAAFLEEVRSSLAVYGTLFAVVYASLYARFAAQWNYLAGLYNKLLEVECKLTGTETEDQKWAFSSWKASFVEDADDLHLLTKRMFVPAMREWLGDAEVRSAFIKGAIGGQRRLERLDARLANVNDQ